MTETPDLDMPYQVDHFTNKDSFKKSPDKPYNVPVLSRL